jgi:ABC-type glycerol-3-phosphate transport system substrate-binding protein
MSNFQTILIAIFLSFFVFGVLIFSGLIDIGKTKENTSLQGKVVIWGTFPSGVMIDVIKNIKSNNKDLNISYIRKDQMTYQQDLIEAFANGVAPDLFIITPDMIIRNTNFFYKIPYESYAEKTYRDTFINGAEIYLDTEGALAFPLVVDPMVLYYNKDILSNEGIVSPPTTWDELFTLNSTLTKKENNGTISQSMIALGQYDNVNNAKDILVNLLLQNNNSLIKKNEKGLYISTLSSNPSNLSVTPAQSVLTFYNEFSNPSNIAYSWNKSLPESRDMFTSGKMAFYLGRASELFSIESINPNLSFDVTQIPQIKNSTTKRAYGEIYAMAINKKSPNVSTAFNVASNIALGDEAKNFATASSLPPASKVLLSDKPKDPYLFTFFNSALIVRSWIDPDKIKSDLIFSELVDNILSNRLSIGEAINKAQGQLEILIK